MEEQDIVQQELNRYLDNPNNRLCEMGIFTVKDFKDIRRVLHHTTEDFVIFSNGGGNKFDIWFDRVSINKEGNQEEHKVVDFINYLIKNRKSSIYCYQLNQVQTIIQSII